MDKDLNLYLEHTLLKPEATEAEIRSLCAAAKAYHFYAVCLNSSYISFAKRELQDSPVKVVTVVGFPLGTCLTPVKGQETVLACELGADEIDMVIHVGALKEKRYDYVENDISEVVSIATEYDVPVKVILETCLLTDQEIITACQIAAKAGASFVKTSTGFNSAGAQIEHVKLMKETVGNTVRIKAAGGIRDLQTALAMIEAGADRLGTSASVQIMKEFA